MMMMIVRTHGRKDEFIPDDAFRYGREGVARIPLGQPSIPKVECRTDHTEIHTGKACRLRPIDRTLLVTGR